MQCFLCEKEYDNTHRVPRLLTRCGHTLCEVCIVENLDKDRLSCPQCNIPHVIKSLSNFPTNHALLETKRPSEYICPIHFKEFEIFCKTDSTLICVRCAIESEHKTHDYLSIADAVLGHKKYMLNFKSQCKTNEKTILEEQKSIDAFSQSLTKSFELLYSNFEEMYTEIINLVKSRQELILDRIKTIFEAEMGSLNSKRLIFSDQIELIQQFYKELEEEMTDFQLLKSADLREKLGKRASLKLVSASKRNPFTQFSIDEEISVLMKKIQSTFISLTSSSKLLKTIQEKSSKQFVVKSPKKQASLAKSLDLGKPFHKKIARK